jgi:hypothetical protein
MAKLPLAAAVAISVFAASVAVRTAADAKAGVDWPSFRGIRGAGVADGFPTATTWDVPAKKNVLWSIPVVGLGHSSPVIWGDQLCMTTAISGKGGRGLKIGLYGNVESVNDDTSHVWKLLCTTRKPASRSWTKQSCPACRRSNGIPNPRTPTRHSPLTARVLSRCWDPKASTRST